MNELLKIAISVLAPIGVILAVMLHKKLPIRIDELADVFKGIGWVRYFSILTAMLSLYILLSNLTF